MDGHQSAIVLKTPSNRLQLYTKLPNTTTLVNFKNNYFRLQRNREKKTSNMFNARNKGNLLEIPKQKIEK